MTLLFIPALHLFLSLHPQFGSMDFLKTLRLQSNNNGVSTGSKWLPSKGETIDSYSPVDGKLIGSIVSADRDTYDKTIATAQDAFKQWRLVPAPRRGEIV